MGRQSFLDAVAHLRAGQQLEKCVGTGLFCLAQYHPRQPSPGLFNDLRLSLCHSRLTRKYVQ
jgi:hypothetical protein